MQSGTDFAAMIPCHNEADTIARVVTETRRHVPVVIVVDDGSTDDTAAEARRSGAEVIRHLPCRGNGVALEAGFRRSLFIFIARPGRLV